MDKWSAFAMKRRFFKLCLFLLLGAIINVVVAWSGFLDARTNQPWNRAAAMGTEEEMELWNRHLSPGWPPYPATSGREVRVTAQIEFVGYISVSEDGSQNFGVTRIVCGFPLRCFSWEEWWGSALYAGTPPGDNGLHIANLSLPRRILWLGFLTNALLYSAILWILFVLPFVPRLRRRWRIKRGLCPACAYPVGDSAVCTECGEAVKA